jgi:hypothetical protein
MAADQEIDIIDVKVIKETTTVGTKILTSTDIGVEVQAAIRTKNIEIKAYVNLKYRNPMIGISIAINIGIIKIHIIDSKNILNAANLTMR